MRFMVRLAAVVLAAVAGGPLTATAVRPVSGMSSWGVPDNPRPPVSAFIAEPRCHAALPLVIANMRTSLPEVPVQVFYSLHNKRFVHELVPPLAAGWVDREAAAPDAAATAPPALRSRGGAAQAQRAWGRTAGGWPALTLEPLPKGFYTKMNYTAYSLLLESPEFWDLVLGDKVLVFEPDSWVCKNAVPKLQQWLQYDLDYVGAPWNHYVKGCPGGVGNGGFSLRSRRVMRELAAAGQHLPAEDRHPEDIWFCKQLQRSKESKEIDAVFTWHVPDAQARSARKGDALESSSFRLAGSAGRFRIRYFPKGQPEARDDFCSAYVIGEDKDSFLQMKLAIGDEERLLGEEGPVLFKVGEHIGTMDFSKAPAGGVALTAVLVQQDLGARLPVRPLGDSFAEEERVDITKGNPLGVHRPWNYEAEWFMLKDNCPGLHLLQKIWSPEPDPSWCPRDTGAASSYLEEYRQFLHSARLRSGAPWQSGPLQPGLWLACLLAAILFS